MNYYQNVHLAVYKRNLETQALKRRVAEIDHSVAVRATIGLWLGVAAVIGVLLVAIF